MGVLLLAAALLLCADDPAGGAPGPVAPEGPCIPPAANWHPIITGDDAARLRNIRKTWNDTLAIVRPTHADEIAAEGALLDPDAALSDATPGAGAYRCRVLKLGAQAAGQDDFRTFPGVPCEIVAQADGRFAFTMTGAQQRPIGRLYPDNSRRMVYLGTLELGDERRSYRYGLDHDRDQVAALERIGDDRWRLVFPAPHFESLLDVIEIIPAAP